MGDPSTAILMSEKLIEALESPFLKEICSESQLTSLTETVNKIRSVLLDADQRQWDLVNEEKMWIRELRGWVYDAEDKMEKFLTLAELHHKYKAYKLSEKLRLYFSSNNPTLVARSISRGLLNMGTKLDYLASNCSRFGFRIDYKPIPMRREETCSYVCESSIIGRAKDVEAVMGMLLDSAIEKDVGFISIVGMGGLGKTALAQLVCNDDRVGSEFCMKAWVAVCDQGLNRSDLVKTVLVRCLDLRGLKSGADASLEEIVYQFTEKLRGRKFFIVLDDVWNEHRDEWAKLMDILRIGGRGSKVLVTTRSNAVAGIVSQQHIYELRGLSDEDSLHLFEMVAFEPGHELDPELVSIGKKIVESCAHIPLAIRVAGSLLYGQPKSKWQAFHAIRVYEYDMAPILKLSYDDLAPSLRSCFSYISMFPKSSVIEKETLINHWMAQGFVVPLYAGQSLEDAAEEYFTVLLQRSFFKDVEKDEFGDIVLCKMHDIMHDLAAQVAGEEIFQPTCEPNDLVNQIRHVSHAGERCAGINFLNPMIRSYLQTGLVYSLELDTLFRNFVGLRLLDLRGSCFESLPESIGKLTCLRYLGLSKNVSLITLPDSITKLHKLQTLNLDGCYKIKQLPYGFCKLVELRHLYLHWDGLTCMPPDMNKLSQLCMLTSFVIADEDSRRKQGVSHLEELGALTNLKGHLNICILESFAHAEGEDTEERYLMGMAMLKEIDIYFRGSLYVDCPKETTLSHETLLKSLQPHGNLKGLMLSGYQGMKIPWCIGDKDLSRNLPNLVKIELKSCSVITCLPSFRKLQCLKSLALYNLRNLEYMEDASSFGTVSESRSTEPELFFPSLKRLELVNLPKLKGWWGAHSDSGEFNQSGISQQASFTQLSDLLIEWCHELTSFPYCTSLGKLCLRGFNQMLQLGDDSRGFTLLSDCKTICPNLREVEIDRVDYHKSQPAGSSTRWQLSWDEELENLSEADELLPCFDYVH